MKIHADITEDVLVDAVTRRNTQLDNPGFCLACGAEHYACEPDAVKYECEECGERKVYGAEEILIRFRL